MSYLLQTVGIGIALLTAFVLMGRYVGLRDFNSARIGVQRGALVFLAIWLIGVGIGMTHIIIKTGISVKEDGPFFLIQFAVPAAVALCIVWMFRSRPDSI